MMEKAVAYETLISL